MTAAFGTPRLDPGGPVAVRANSIRASRVHDERPAHRRSTATGGDGSRGQIVGDAEIQALRQRIERARRRIASATPYSPDWDAASAELELASSLLRDAAARQPRPETPATAPAR